MERVSVNLVALAGFGIFVLLSTTAPPVLGEIATNSEEMQFPERYKMIIEELVAQNNIYKTANQEKKMMITQPLNTFDVFKKAINKQEVELKKDLQCVEAGRYCNFVFGPQCCSIGIACVPPSLIGGVCVA